MMSLEPAQWSVSVVTVLTAEKGRNQSNNYQINRPSIMRQSARPRQRAVLAPKNKKNKPHGKITIIS